MRLDNVVFQLHFANYRTGAKQLVSHNYIYVKNKKVNVILIPVNESRNKEIVKQISKFIDDVYTVVLWPENVKE